MTRIKNELDVIGNVDICIYNNNKVFKEISKHNQITSKGIVNLLQTMTLARSAFINGIGIIYTDPAVSSGVEQEKVFNNFSSVKVVNGTQPYAEFRFYLSSDQLNGCTILGANLKTKDSTGTLIDFATVRTTDTLPDGITPVIVDGEIGKVSTITVLYIWRIGISSQFVSALY